MEEIKKPRKEPEQIRKELEALQRIVDNPLNALPVWAPFLRFAQYYILNVHKRMMHELKISLGRRILDTIVECMAMLPRCQFGTRQRKIEATEKFLDNFGFILAAVEMLAVTPDTGVDPLKIATMAELIKEIRRQMGAFQRYLSSTEMKRYRQSPDPKGEGSEQVEL